MAYFSSKARKNQPMKHNELGKWGEAYALQYLLSLGYKLLVKNYRFSRMEIDLVLIDAQTLVIVEVKTRKSSIFEAPWRSVHLNKQKQIVRVADNYSKLIQWPHEVRFDIVSIVHNRNRTDLTHIKDAFGAGL